MSVESVRERVQRILTEEYGQVIVDQDGDFVINNGSARIFISVTEIKLGVVVKLYSPLLRNVPTSADVFKWVATEGQNRWFAHATLLEQDDATCHITWEHDLLGDYLDREELLHAVVAVAAGADDLDDKVQKMFGGKRASDR